MRPAHHSGKSPTATVAVRNVDVLRFDEAQAIISQGLDIGEIVVTAGVQALHPGQKVRLKVFVGAYRGLDRILRALASSEIDNQVSRLPGVANEAAVPTDVDSESGDNVSAFARRLHKELVSARAAANMSGDTGVREHVSH